MGVLDLMGHVQKQGELGRERGQQTRLGMLAGQSYGATTEQRPEILSQMAQINPAMAQQQQTQFQGQDDRTATKAAAAAQYVLNAQKTGDPNAVRGAYMTVRPFLEEIGRAQGKVPPPEWSDDMLPMLHQVVSAGGGQAQQAEQFTLAPGAARYGPDGKLLVQQPFAPENPQNATFQVDQEGNGWWLSPGQPPVPAMGGGASAPQAAPPAFSGMGSPGQPPVTTGGLVDNAESSQFVASIGDIVKPFGGSIGSTTGGKHNVGSLHPGGNAVDIPLGDWRKIPPEQQQAMLTALQQQPGIRVRDERQRPPGQKEWSGPHLHVERVGQGLGGGPKFGTKQEGDKAPSGYRYGSDGNLVFIPGGPADPASQSQSKGAPTEGERKSATLLKRLTGSLAQLEKAVADSPESASPSLASEAARSLPFVGQAVSNSITPAARQRVEAAQLDILDAALTLGTGAAYTREQLEGYRKSYFPQIGDDKTTIDDKAARLSNVIEAARIASGRAGPDSPAAGKPAAPPAERRARNPQTGQVLVLRNGQWMPE